MRIEDNFKWFTGVVEDRNDPDRLNRVRVRIFGSHTKDKHNIATADLPWAQVMMPTTSSSNSGLGQTVHGLVEGSWVVGFWKDGNSKQDPMIMGSFIGVNQGSIYTVVDIKEGKESSTTLDLIDDSDRTTKGFIDPRLESWTGYKDTPEGKEPDHNRTRDSSLTLDLKNSPRIDGKDKGVNYPRFQYLSKTDVNDLARGWTGVPATSEAEDNPYKLMTLKEAKAKIKDPDTGEAAYEEQEDGTMGLVATGYNASKVDKDFLEIIRQEIAADAAADKLMREYNENQERRATAEATIVHDGEPLFTSDYDFVYPNNVIEAGGVKKTLFGAEGIKDPRGFMKMRGDLESFKAVQYTGTTEEVEAAREQLKNPANDELRSTWVAPKYPFNHVYESESGHVIEIDDTPGYERINLFHRKGARIEINNEGEIHMLAAPGQDMNLQAANVNIQNTGSGNCNISADCDLNFKGKETINVNCEGPTNIVSKGKTKLFSLVDNVFSALGKNIIG